MVQSNIRPVNIYIRSHTNNTRKYNFRSIILMNLETKYIGDQIQNVIKNSITLSSSVNFSIQGFSA